MRIYQGNNQQCCGIVRQDNDNRHHLRRFETPRCQNNVSDAQLKVCVNPKQDMCYQHCDCEGCSNKYASTFNRGKRFSKLKKKIYDKEHRSKAEIKAKAKIQTKEYRNRPEVKEKYKDWYNTPETKLKRKQQRESRLAKPVEENTVKIHVEYKTFINAEKDIEKLRSICLTLNRRFPYLMQAIVIESKETLIAYQKEKQIEKLGNQIKKLRREIDEVRSK